MRTHRGCCKPALCLALILPALAQASTLVVLDWGAPYRYQIVPGTAGGGAGGGLVSPAIDDSNWPVRPAPFKMSDRDTIFSCVGSGTFSWGDSSVVARTWVQIPRGTTQVLTWVRYSNHTGLFYDGGRVITIQAGGCPYASNYPPGPYSDPIYWSPEPGRHLLTLIGGKVYVPRPDGWQGSYADVQMVATIGAPVATILAPAPNSSTAANLLTAWTGDQDNLQYAWRLDADAWSDFSAQTSVLLTNLGQGPHQLSVVAKNEYGDVTITPALTNFTVTGSPVDLGDAGLAAPFSLGVFPNPAVTVASVQFSIPTAGLASVDVIDVAGRLVKQLRSGPCSPGHYAALWRLEDAAGARVPAGVYLVRLHAPGAQETHRLIVVR
jgi:hypothetical protein